MTISKERFEQIALEVWNDGATEYDDREGDLIITDFAHALIKRVEAESECVFIQTKTKGSIPVLQMPLVSEE